MSSIAPMPLRCIGDTRLRGLHMRVLMVAAAHDLLSDSRSRGHGCWTANKRLALMLGCNYTNLSTALSDLVKFGYIEAGRYPPDKRQRVYRVVYNSTDSAVMKGSIDYENRHRLSPPSGRGWF